MIRPDFREVKNELYHYGTKGKSGRYPLGSGERPYQDYPGMRKRRKPGRIALARLNALNTRKEAWEIDKKRLEERKNASYRNYPSMTKKQIEKNEKYFNNSIKFDNDNIERYTKKVEKKLQRFKDAGVELSKKKNVEKYDSIRYKELILFKGTKYYKKAKDKKLDDKNKKRGKATYDSQVRQMNQINMMNQQLQQQMQEQQQIMQQQQTINMMSHPFMF